MSDRKTFALLTAARWAPIGLMTPISVLYMQSRGLSLSTIGVVAIVYTLTVAALEIPTGSFADAFGHRRILVIGTGVSIAKFSLMFLANGAALFIIASVLHGTERALRSGPLEAWYVARQPHDVRRGLSAGAIAEAVALAAGALLAGLLPLVFSGSAPVRVPIAAAVVLEVAHLGALFVLLPRATGSGAAPARIAFTTVAHAGRDPHLRRLLLAPLTLGFALYSVELLWQPRLATFVGTDDTVVFGVFATVAFACSALGAWLVVHASHRRDPAAAALVTMLLYGATLVALAGASGVGMLAVAFGSGYFFVGAVGPLHGELLHHRVPDTARATALSLVSMAGMTGLMVAALALPPVAEHVSTGAAWAVSAVVIALGSLCYLALREQTQVRRGDGTR
jgi:MFS family permease